MILNFNEIPRANTGNGDQDTFEFFSRDFLEIIGYKILQNPDRGPDGKKDLIVQESRQGVSGITHIKWLVSCKHYSHSGRSVSDTDEPNIIDRVETHGCNGFIGFFSTIPSVSLARNLECLKNRVNIQYFDSARIEKILFESVEGTRLASRYMPESFAKYSKENPKPAKIFSDEPEILCEYCNKNLLINNDGIFVTIKKIEHNDFSSYSKYPYSIAYFSCKGSCDRILKSKYVTDYNHVDSWADIKDYTLPTGFIKKIMAWMNCLQAGETIEGQAFDKLKQLILNAFPHISREQTSEEEEKIKKLIQSGFLDLL